MSPETTAQGHGVTATHTPSRGGPTVRPRLAWRAWFRALTFRVLTFRVLTFRVLALVALAAAAGAGLYAGMLQLTGNFHTVIANEIYRSAQPSAAEIHRYRALFGIRTIVNLRGPNTGRAWYDEEVAAARRLGIAHIDFKMSAKRDLSQARAAELVELLRSADKPILIHCQGGADRSGLAAALYIAGVAHGDEETAEDQISIRFGHIGIPLISSAYAMDRSWEQLERWLGFSNS